MLIFIRKEKKEIKIKKNYINNIYKKKEKEEEKIKRKINMNI